MPGRKCRFKFTRLPTKPPEAKTELWYIADAAPGAELYVGLKRGVTRQEFEQRLRAGSVAECVHRVKVQAGDAMFLPSGRLHAVGAGLVIFEIQQNSDTTYRVFDWNRTGLDGKPRGLHLQKSLASIDFNDFEPSLLGSDFSGTGPIKARPLANDSLFRIDGYLTNSGASMRLLPDKMQIIAVLTGQMNVSGWEGDLRLSAGRFCLIPAGITGIELQTDDRATFLLIEAGGN